MVTLSKYLKVNLPTIRNNWSDEYIREKSDNDIEKYIQSKKNRVKSIVFNFWVSADITIEEAQNKIELYLTKHLKQ